MVLNFDCISFSVQKSPHGLAYDVLIKPPSASKVIPEYSPSPSSKEKLLEKHKSAEERKRVGNSSIVNKSVFQCFVFAPTHYNARIKHCEGDRFISRRPMVEINTVRI